ncbi:hypothetical protein OED52_09420 [Rhodococcus sp. Z13]|uniref:Uncharacterized protein n=1 Tax=Rhodococcus sacchari TaxID=2962047 RepID=A0ACD4DKX2_9NOCA|nr:hypothetical protein [Rhodococcus sp. Z13]UYP20708.1 hypothetical protein OED52_09420 [Rhodococcus sp. Z13]
MQETTAMPVAPESSPTVLDALRASPVGPWLDVPLPVLPEPVLCDAILPLPDPDAIAALLQSIPFPTLPEIEALTRPIAELGSMFGTGILDGLDPSMLLQQGSRLLEAATALGRTALHALPESWEGATADESAGHTVRAQQTALELAERGDRIGDVTRAATATVERGNIELTGIARSFAATAVAAAPALATPAGQAALLASAAEHLQAALAVVARTRGELAVHTAAMTALTTPIPVPEPVAVAGLPQVRELVGTAPDVASSMAAPFTTTGTHAATVPTSYAGTVPTAHAAALTAPSAGPGAGVPTASAGGLSGYAPAGLPPAGAPVAAAVPAMSPAGGGVPVAGTGTAAAGSRMPAGGIAPASAARGSDDEEHSPSRLLSAAGSGTEVVGDLPMVVPAVIGASEEF